MRATDRAAWGSLLAALTLASPAPGLALAAVEGKPRIVDGASLEIAGRRFRLAGIEAPGLDQVCERAGQAYDCGKVARAVLWNLIDGREVSCEPARDAGAAGAGAIAAICKAGDTNLGERMVAAGWAFADRSAAEAYGALEDEAKKARRGLWTGSVEPPAGGPKPASEAQP